MACNFTKMLLLKGNNISARESQILIATDLNWEFINKNMFWVSFMIESHMQMLMLKSTWFLEDDTDWNFSRDSLSHLQDRFAKGNGWK